MHLCFRETAQYNFFHILMAVMTRMCGNPETECVLAKNMWLFLNYYTHLSPIAVSSWSLTKQSLPR